MSIDKAKFDDNNHQLNFDFDEWVTLNKIDPQAFEERRLQWCKQMINNSPKQYQKRLSGLLFQINMEKRRSSNAMDSCIRISGLMWDKFTELRGELQSLANQGRNQNALFNSQKFSRRTTSLKKNAKIIDFSSAVSAQENF